jgi:hypothetical protein
MVGLPGAVGSKVVVGPVEAARAAEGAGEAERGFEDGHGIAVERRRGIGAGRERLDVVCHWGLAVGLAVVGGDDPDQDGRRVGAPLVVTRTGLDGVAGDGQVVDERALVEQLASPCLQGDDLRTQGEALGGNGVAERAVQGADEGEAAIGRGAEGVDEALGGLVSAERVGCAVERHEGQLGGGVVLEDGLVVGGREHVLVGGRGGRLAEVFADVRAGGDIRDLGRRSAVGGDRLAEQRGGIGHPGAGRAEDGVQLDEPEAVSMCVCGVDDP